MQSLPSFEVQSQICQPESNCFLDGLPTVPHCFMGWRIWISTRWGHNSFIIFIHSSNTYLIWNKPSLGRKYQCHKSRRLSFSTSPTTKNITSLAISFTYVLKKWGRDCQVNTIRLFFFHLLFWHCSYHCTLGFYICCHSYLFAFSTQRHVFPFDGHFCPVIDKELFSLAEIQPIYIARACYNTSHVSSSEK